MNIELWMKFKICPCEKFMNRPSLVLFAEATPDQKISRKTTCDDLGIVDFWIIISISEIWIFEA